MTDLREVTTVIPEVSADSDVVIGDPGVFQQFWGSFTKNQRLKVLFSFIESLRGCP